MKIIKHLKESLYYLFISELIVMMSLLITYFIGEYSINLFFLSYKIIDAVFLFWCFLYFISIIIGWYINSYKKYQSVC